MKFSSFIFLSPERVHPFDRLWMGPGHGCRQRR